MKNPEQEPLKNAFNGDINDFQKLFTEFHQQLKSYLYRLLADRKDAEDLTHDTFIRAFDKLGTFKGESTLKTWVFQIGTNLAFTHLKKRKRWTPDVSAKAKEIVLNNETVYQEIVKVHQSSPSGTYDIKEHIDTCFTCISKNLPIENQVTLILKDVYDFSLQEIELILEKTEGVIKYLLKDARKSMTEIFDNRCALVNKNGVCHQCSELNGWFNPKQDQQKSLMKINLVKGSKKFDREKLFKMRTNLIKNIDPLRSEGNELQEILLKCNRMAMGEIPVNI